MSQKLYGKYRGIVVDNNDPLKLGRLKIRVQAAYGDQARDVLPWAWPCFADGGTAGNGIFHVPEIGAGVYVEFLCKNSVPDTSYPVWSGSWHASGATPAEVEGEPADAHYYKVYHTPGGHKVVICDKPGSKRILIEHADGPLIELSSSGIKIKGNVVVEGSINATGSIIDAGGNTNHHSH